MHPSKIPRKCLAKLNLKHETMFLSYYKNYITTFRIEESRIISGQRTFDEREREKENYFQGLVS